LVGAFSCVLQTGGEPLEEQFIEEGREWVGCLSTTTFARSSLAAAAGAPAPSPSAGTTSYELR